MVGVPFLVSRCDCGPSVRIGWPLPCLSRSAAMIVGPKKNTKNKAVRRRAGGAESDVAETGSAG